MQRDREGIRKMERLVLQKSYLFLTPLIVATAPLFLPYILLCKTQGRSVNTFDNGMHLPLLLAVPRSIMGCFRINIGGVSRERRG